MPFNSFDPPSPHFNLRLVKTFQDLRDNVLEWVQRYFIYVGNYIAQDLLPSLNKVLYGQGPDITSASSITVTNMVHQITGSTTILNINLPSGSNAVGPLCLYAVNGVTISAAGNVAQSFVLSPGHSVVLFWTPNQGQWVGVSS